MKGGLINMEYRKLGELVEVVSGQIMTRVKASGGNDKAIEKRKVIIPKAIGKNGIIDVSQLAEEQITAKIPENRITQIGDIVIKLNSPYDSAVIDENTSECVVPSFCAIIRIKENINLDYLLAFLNSNQCKRQLESQVQGSIMTILSVGKLKEVLVPMVDETKQNKIGSEFIKTQTKMSIIRRIAELEELKNDVYFNELGE